MLWNSAASERRHYNTAIPTTLQARPLFETVAMENITNNEFSKTVLTWSEAAGPLVDKDDLSKKPPIIFDGWPAALEQVDQKPCAVLWRWTENDTKTRWTKPPLIPGSGPNYAFAKTNDPSTWGTSEAVLNDIAINPELGAGVAIYQSETTAGCGLGCVDLDNIRDADGSIRAWALEIIRRCGSYFELSPSGGGIKVYGLVKKRNSTYGKIKFPDGEIELFANCNRYLCVTGRSPDPSAQLADITEIFNELVAQAEAQKSSSSAGQPTDDEIQESDAADSREHKGRGAFAQALKDLQGDLPDCRSEDVVKALDYWDPNSYDDWVTVLLALHGTPGGREIAFAWAAKSKKFNEAENQRKWQQTRPSSGIGPATILSRVPREILAEWGREAADKARAQKRESRKPRELLNLEQIAANPTTSLVFCQTEADAIVAGQIFAKSIATAAPDGVNRTNLSCLAGRKVLVIPNTGDNARLFLEQISPAIHRIGAVVREIDALAVSAIAPDGSDRPASSIWTLRSAAEEWQPDLAGLKEALLSCKRDYAPPPPPTGYISFEAFESGPKGITVELVKGRGGNAQIIKIPICGALKVLGRQRNPEGSGWGVLVETKDADNRLHQVSIPYADLQGDAAAVAATLGDRGLWVNRSAHRYLCDYLLGVNPGDSICVLNRTGYHRIADDTVFMLPTETIGAPAGQTFVLRSSQKDIYQRKGTFEGWQETVASPAGQHVILTLAMSTALAGPLHYWIGADGGGINLFGPSSSGKTTGLGVAASVWGSAEFVRSWRATSNAVEGLAESTSDTLTCLDELGLVTGHELGAITYQISGGVGKGRSDRLGNLRPSKTFRASILSTGEIPISAKLAEEKRVLRAGQMVRIADINADAGDGLGIFNKTLPGGVSAAEFSKSLKRATSTHCGHAGPEYVRRFMSEGYTGEIVRSLVSEFTKSAAPPDSDGQTLRVADRLGIISAAGEIGIQLGVLPWRPGTASAAAKWALNSWITARGSSSEAFETRQIIDRLQLTIERDGDARFEKIPDGISEVPGRVVLNRLGWRKGSGEFQEWWVPKESWKEIFAGLDPKLAAKVLTERGIIKRASDGFQINQRVDGRQIRCYTITAKVLGGDL